jgi:hypothetical protein
MMLKIHAAIVVALFSLPSFMFAQQGEKKQSTTPCKAVCYTYQQFVNQERDRVETQGFRFISPQDISSKIKIISVQTRPDLAGPPAPAVDDELYVQDNGSTIWKATLSDQRNSVGFSLLADRLTPGQHLIQLWYADTQPPDAHFFADVCGVAFYGSDKNCVTFREGKTFGSGIVRNGVRVVVKDAKLWVSKVENPKVSTGCTCESSAASKAH